MSKWALASGPEMVPVPIDPRKYKQLLAEIAEILLESYGQLQKSFMVKPIGTAPATLKKSEGSDEQ